MKNLALLAILLATAGVAAADGGHEHGKQRSQAAAGEEYAFGRAGDPAKATRTVRVDMSDKMRFTPDRLVVRQGETVKFIVRNRGKVEHELVIGRHDDLKAHAELMKKHPNMEHDDPYGVEVEPGKTGTIVWQFTKAGQFHFGCLVPGHLESGMVGQIAVQSR